MALSKGDIEAFAKLRAEKDVLEKDLRAARSAVVTLRAQLDNRYADLNDREDTIVRLKAGQSPTVGHNLTDDICRQIAEKAARATADAILSALGATRRQATPAEEAERIKRMTPPPEDATPRARTLDTEPDDGEAEMRQAVKRSAADILKRLK